MKQLVLIFALLTFTATLSQVGINTTNPQETLDVNGTTKFRITNQTSVTTTKIGGLDNNGVFREIEIGDNLKLENNKIKVTETKKYSFGAITINNNNNNDSHDNVDLLVGPGEANEDKSIIRVFLTDAGKKIKFTGIKAGTDGQHIWLYPQDNELDLKDNDSNSLNANQIEKNAKHKAKQYEMVKLVYDATRAKWIIMSHNG